MAIVKKSDQKAAPAAAEKPKGDKPSVWLKMTQKGADGKYPKSSPIFGFYIDPQAGTENFPDGNLRLQGRANPQGEDIVIPAGAICEINLHKLFEALGIKVKVNANKEVSVEEA